VRLLLLFLFQLIGWFWLKTQIGEIGLKAFLPVLFLQLTALIYGITAEEKGGRY
jgi:hypothetical protein